MNPRQLYFEPIDDGVVIDHIEERRGYAVESMLRMFYRDIPTNRHESCSSGRYGTKDVLQVKEWEPNETDLVRLSLYAKSEQPITVNIVRGGHVEKRRLELPDRVIDVLLCPSDDCATNLPEEIADPVINIEPGEPVRFRCDYCEQSFSSDTFTYKKGE